jgi:formate/nitrite transporter FocA (FNT family)
MREHSRLEAHKENIEGQTQNLTMPLTYIFVGAVLTAFLVMDSSAVNIAGMRITGMNAVDNLLTGKKIHSFIGDADIDKLLVSFIRGFFFFAVTGALPGLAIYITRKRKRAKDKLFVMIWGALVGAPLAYIIFNDFIMPLL